MSTGREDGTYLVILRPFLLQVFHNISQLVFQIIIHHDVVVIVANILLPPFYMTFDAMYIVVDFLKDRRGMRRKRHHVIFEC